MTHIEATKRVKENIGFDRADYEHQQQPQKRRNADLLRDDPKRMPILPEPRVVRAASTTPFHLKPVFQPQEPPLPPPSISKVHGSYRTTRGLGSGVLFVRNGGSSPNEARIHAGEHIVTCLGCQATLRVNLMSTLARCPECSTVSPVTSTIRQ
ncbi:hypothetical protein IV203_015871 [Nitzschia inconspicua]|uniref:Uncharacterized protein n=1 Tax=Nitzschia inconspicua TaxID=303405 RepID=A0A9K3LC11_9STRA|nr:hypothetical protein IV203_015871 [Nitzschia inconspicua]